MLKFLDYKEFDASAIRLAFKLYFTKNDTLVIPNNNDHLKDLVNLASAWNLNYRICSFIPANTIFITI